jgi:hypothetical protein
VTKQQHPKAFSFRQRERKLRKEKKENNLKIWEFEDLGLSDSKLALLKYPNTKR